MGFRPVQAVDPVGGPTTIEDGSRARPTPGTLSCIDACLACYGLCLGMATNHGLAKEGAHAGQERVRLLLACSELCRTHAHLMILGASQAKSTAAACAGTCRLCADSCERVGDMAGCVAGRRTCAESCSSMA